MEVKGEKLINSSQEVSTGQELISQKLVGLILARANLEAQVADSKDVLKHNEGLISSMEFQKSNMSKMFANLQTILRQEKEKNEQYDNYAMEALSFEKGTNLHEYYLRLRRKYQISQYERVEKELAKSRKGSFLFLYNKKTSLLWFMIH